MADERPSLFDRLLGRTPEPVVTAPKSEISIIPDWENSPYARAAVGQGGVMKRSVAQLRRWSRNNPVDCAGGETRDTIPAVLEVLARSSAVDAVVYLGIVIQAKGQHAFGHADQHHVRPFQSFGRMKG